VAQEETRIRQRLAEKVVMAEATAAAAAVVAHPATATKAEQEARLAKASS
jgi:hypothetical protein